MSALNFTLTFSYFPLSSSFSCNCFPSNYVFHCDWYNVVKQRFNTGFKCCLPFLRLPFSLSSVHVFLSFCTYPPSSPTDPFLTLSLIRILNSVSRLYPNTREMASVSQSASLDLSIRHLLEFLSGTGDNRPNFFSHSCHSMFHNSNVIKSTLLLSRLYFHRVQLT